MRLHARRRGREPTVAPAISISRSARRSPAIGGRFTARAPLNACSTPGDRRQPHARRRAGDACRRRTKRWRRRAAGSIRRSMPRRQRERQHNNGAQFGLGLPALSALFQPVPRRPDGELHDRLRRARRARSRRAGARRRAGLRARRRLSDPHRQCGDPGAHHRVGPRADRRRRHHRRRRDQSAPGAERGEAPASRPSSTSRPRRASSPPTAPCCRRCASSSASRATRSRCWSARRPPPWSPPDFDLDHITLPAELPLSLPSELVRQRPDLLAAEAQLHRRGRGRHRHRAALSHITFSAAASRRSSLDTLFHAASNIWTLGATCRAALPRRRARGAKRAARTTSTRRSRITSRPCSSPSARSPTCSTRWATMPSCWRSSGLRCGGSPRN